TPDPGPTGVIDISAVNALTGVATDLVTLDDLDLSGLPPVATGNATGTVISYTTPGGSPKAVYLSYANPSQVTSLDLDPSTTAVTCGGLTATVAVCAESRSGDSVTHALAKLPLDGSAGTDLVADGDFATLAVTATQAGWRDGDGLFSTVPLAGGAVVTRTAPVASMASTGTAFAVTAGGEEDRATILLLATATGTASTVVLPTASPVTARLLALSPGRVTWTDTAGAGIPVWTKRYAGNTLATGPGTPVSGSSNWELAASGRRTAFTVDDQGGSATLLKVTTGADVATIATDHGDGISNVSISGTRVLYNASGTWSLYDLIAARRTDLTWLTGASEATIWGNYVAYIAADGSVQRRDLTASGEPVHLAPAAPGIADGYLSGRLYMWGDYVAWQYGVCGDTCTTYAGYRNARTLTPATPIEDGVTLASLGSDGAVLGRAPVLDGMTAQQDVGEARAYSVRDLSTGVETPISADLTQSDQVSTDSGIAAWINDDEVPVTMALPAHAANPPRFLGNPFVKTIAEKNKPWAWYAELPASAAMTTCQVLVKSGATTVRTLSCDAAAATQGGALVTWDGKGATGGSLAGGNYSWTLVASNGDGPLRAADGTTTSVGGTIALPAPPAVKPAVKSNPESKTVSNGATVTFTASATGTPAPSVQWQVSSNGGKTFAPMAGKTSATLSFKAARSQSKFRYRAVFTNSAGSALTSAAQLTVR
ncbi:MAG: hypothetical protein JWO79_1631, partial [Actinomycetia bacterium]|nr:hypothetical protein [Actinomycetes bacterium]